LSVIQRLKEYSKVIFNESVKEWKDSGGNVVGYSCVTTPPEILLAADILPYRIRALGNPNTEMADACLARFNCSFARSCLQLGLDGTYDFLDGIVETNGCDHLRGMFENWQYNRPLKFFHYLKVPHQTNDDALKYYIGELLLYKQAVEAHFEVEITEDRLERAFEMEEKVSAVLRETYEIRRDENPRISGEEALCFYLLSTAMHPQKFLLFAGEALEEVKSRAPLEYRARIMLCGAATDEIDLLSEIEGLGGLIVSDALCFGSRAFFTTPVRVDDRIEILARRVLDGILCPRMYEEFPKRLNFILDEVESAKVDGVILVCNKFCDLHGVDNVQIRLSLEERGIPALQLEKDYGSGADVGRIRTRVQAFLERIESRIR